MLDSNYENKSCGFGEDLVVYLYDEISESDKIKFEKHLSNCQTCEKELAGFGLVRNSINKWKAEDFAKLSHPKIELEYGEFEKKSQIMETEKSGWFGELKGIFSGFPTWANAGAAFAVLSICAVIAIIAFNYSGNVEVVDNSDKQTVEETEPVKEEFVSPQTEEITITQNAEEESVKEETFKPQITSKAEIKKKPQKYRVVKKQNDTLAKNKTRKNNKIENKKPNDEMTAGNSNQEKYLNNFSEPDVPELSNFVEEDVEFEDETDSIRLTDLFDEVGGDK